MGAMGAEGCQGRQDGLHCGFGLDERRDHDTHFDARPGGDARQPDLARPRVPGELGPPRLRAADDQPLRTRLRQWHRIHRQLLDPALRPAIDVELVDHHAQLGHQGHAHPQPRAGGQRHAVPHRAPLDDPPRPQPRRQARAVRRHPDREPRHVHPGAFEGREFTQAGHLGTQRLDQLRPQGQQGVFAVHQRLQAGQAFAQGGRGGIRGQGEQDVAPHGGHRGQDGSL